MAQAQLDYKSATIQLTDDSFDAFCEDLSMMFDVQMDYSQASEPIVGKISDLKKDFKKLSSVFTVSSEGGLDGKFYLIVDKVGLFVLAGTFVMLPEKVILNNSKTGKVADAKEIGDALGEVGNLMVGSWDRIFRENFPDHGHFLQSGTHVGDGWQSTEEGLGLSDEEEVLIVRYNLELDPYSEMKCAAVYPLSIFSDTKSPKNENIEEQTVENQQNLEDNADSSTQQSQPENSVADTTNDAEPEVAQAQDQSELNDENAVNEEKAVAEEETSSNAEGEELPRGDALGVEESPDEPGEPQNASQESESAVEEVSQPLPEQEVTESEGQPEVSQPEAVETDQPSTESEQNQTENLPEQTEPESAQVDSEPEIDQVESTPEQEAEPVASAPEKSAGEDVSSDKTVSEAAEKPEKEVSAESAGKVEEVVTADLNTAQPAAGVSDKGQVEAVGADESDQEQERPVTEAIRRLTQSLLREGERVGEAESEPQVAAGKALKVCDVMNKTLLWVADDDTVEHVQSMMQQNNFGYVLVGTDGKLEGIVSNSDVRGAMSPYLQAMFLKWRRPLDLATMQIKVKWMMSKPVMTVGPDVGINEVMSKMIQSKCRALPVVESNGSVVGIVTAFDIFAKLLP